MKRKPKGKKTAPQPWIQLELPDLAPLELKKIPELPEITPKGIPEPGLDSLGVNPSLRRRKWSL